VNKEEKENVISPTGPFHGISDNASAADAVKIVQVIAITNTTQILTPS